MDEAITNYTQERLMDNVADAHPASSVAAPGRAFHTRLACTGAPPERPGVRLVVGA